MGGPTGTGPTGTTSTPTQPRSAVIAACMSNGKSMYYFVDANQQIRGWSNPVKNEDEPLAGLRRNYADDFVVINDKPVKSKTRDIATLSFLMANDKNRSKIYFIGEDGFLADVGKDEGRNESQDWKFGTLSSMKYKAYEHTPIAAVMSPWARSIKVYYYKEGEPRNVQWVAWWDERTEKWNTDTTNQGRG